MCNKVVNETLDDNRDNNQQNFNVEETMSTDRRRRIYSQYGIKECHIRTIISVYIVKEYFLRV
jgi:hypothetical protein